MPPIVRKLCLQLSAMALASALMSAHAVAASTDDENMESIKRGMEMSQLLCMRCHSISGISMGPDKKAPPFSRLVEKLTLEGVADQILEGLPLGHEPMPKWEFSEQQAEDLLLYIEFIGRKKQLPKN